MRYYHILFFQIENMESTSDSVCEIMMSLVIEK